MKNFTFILLAILLASCAQKETKTTLRFNVSDYNGNAPRVIIGWSNRSVEIDPSTGQGTYEIDLQAPTYALVEARKLERKLCFLEPGKELTLDYSMKKGEKEITYGGTLGEEAKVLNQPKFYAFTPINYLDKDIQKAARKADSVLDANLKKLEGTAFSKTFKQWEAKRLRVEALAALQRAPLADTAAYVAIIGERIAACDSTYLSIPAYRQVLDQYIRKLVSINRKGKALLEGTDLADMRLACIFEYVKEPAAQGFLVDETLFHLGDLGIKKYEDIYNRYVKDPERLAAYAEACQKAKRIAPGQPCPDFRFADNHGDTVTLADLKGKYVYIDMWATWCGPCKGEMPSLLKLEEEFAGEDILFVSLSIDRNRDIDLWKKTIEEMGLGGIQLHLGENWDWLKIFMPSSMSVPRFVLLDREGKIINSSMSRPSDKATAEKFRELLNNEK